MEAVMGAATVLETKPPVPSIADVLALLARVPVPADAAGMIDQIRGLEDLKSLACARQADTTVAFDLSQRREQADAGVPAVEQGAGVAAQIALARRESPECRTPSPRSGPGC